MYKEDMDKTGANIRPLSDSDQSQTLCHSEFSEKLFQVAHDIQSPLTTLSIMAHVCDELDDEKRSVLAHTVTRIQDMMSNLLDEYRSKKKQRDELQQPVLCVEVIDQILSEKKYQYLHCPVSFEKCCSDQALTASISVQPYQFKRAISNLINNAVESLPKKRIGKVTITLDADDQHVKIIVQDNGKGMKKQLLDKMSRRVSFTSGKLNGHGLGMTQVWRMIEMNAGNLTVHSRPGAGTSFELSFPKFDLADSMQRRAS